MVQYNKGAEADLGSHSLIRSLSVWWPFSFLFSPFHNVLLFFQADPVSKSAHPGPQYWDRRTPKNKTRSEKILKKHV